MQNIILVHGFNEDVESDTLDNLKPFLRTTLIQEADYGHFSLFGVRFFNDNVAKLVAGMANDDSIAIGHSNGCAILAESCEHTDKIKTLILINPALDTDTIFPDTVEKIYVVHNKYDEVVKISSWLPWHDWGKMGKLGYTGKDPRVTNIESFVTFNQVKGHSEVLQKESESLVEYFTALGVLGGLT